MRTPGIVQRHPEVRWLASVVLIVAAGAAITTSVSRAVRDDTHLPATNPEELVSQVLAPHRDGYSGTIVTRINLGLPAPILTALSDALPVGGALLHGSHTMRYWYGSPDRQRVAVIGANTEQDVFRTGTQLLLWDTRTETAHRSTLTSDVTMALPLTGATPAALTPPQLAARILELATDPAAGDDSTDTTLRSGDQVADRSTYELVVSPESSSSRIDSVHIQIDGVALVPLAVQIYARGSNTPAVDVSFTSISFVEPASQNFTFTPPPGSTEPTNGPLGQVPPLGQVATEVAGAGGMSVLGAGWLSVASYPSSPARNALIDATLGDSMQKVTGRWGKGRLLDGSLLSVLVTDKGRIVAGPVAPSVLYRTVSK